MIASPLGSNASQPSGKGEQPWLAALNLFVLGWEPLSA